METPGPVYERPSLKWPVWDEVWAKVRAKVWDRVGHPSLTLKASVVVHACNDQDVTPGNLDLTLKTRYDAIKQAHRERTHARWAKVWSTSPRFQHIQHIDPHAIKRSFLKLTSSFSKRLTGLLNGLRTRHLPLNQHLFRLTKVDSPDCPYCPQTDKTIPHYLFECPQYLAARQVISQALGRKSTSLSHILADLDAINTAQSSATKYKGSCGSWIRDLRAFSRFPLHALYEDLQAATCHGPVIILIASQYSCSAIVVPASGASGDLRHVPLPSICRSR
ncbi:hypothetical protein EDD22DRAFT_975221 [Suillus occidentalis]|nr:hypothetical protein EDD22DRAFT_975221 [Suillus occidentalis]